MCTKCNEIDKKIARYARLSSSVTDPVTIDRFKQLIDELEADKTALHPDRRKAGSLGAF
jgi:hypothetical protein